MPKSKELVNGAEIIELQYKEMIKRAEEAFPGLNQLMVDIMNENTGFEILEEYREVLESISPTKITYSCNSKE